MIFEDRIQANPKLLRLLDPRTNEIVDFEIQDMEPEEILQEGTEISAQILNEIVNGTIIEEVEDTNGHYIKYGNGIMIITQRYSSEVKSWNAWGSCYASNLDQPPNFPIEFISTPIVIKSIGHNNNNCWLYYMGPDSKVRAGNLGVVRPNTGNGTTTVYINIIAIGKWK